MFNIYILIVYFVCCWLLFLACGCGCCGCCCCLSLFVVVVVVVAAAAAAASCYDYLHHIIYTISIYFQVLSLLLYTY